MVLLSGSCETDQPKGDEDSEGAGSPRPASPIHVRIDSSRSSSQDGSGYHDDDDDDSGLAPVRVLTQQKISSPQLMRGVSLRKTLRWGGAVWFAKPTVASEAKKAKLFGSSTPTQTYDIFVSHTWLTPGGLKMLALLLQFGWPAMFISWALGGILALLLCLLGPMPAVTSFHADVTGFQGSIPLHCWLMMAGFIGAFLGLLVYPHISCHGSDTCFLDYVCIHQSDKRMMQQGIRSIGAFLAASRELRVLWSPPYLTRRGA